MSATSWALLGMLSGGDELSGYDIKKWINWVVRFYYQVPAYSQIYSELKKMEQLGLLTSRVHNGDTMRSKRLYKINEAGLAAVTRWTNEAPLEPPMLKHTALLRVTFGHLSQPGRLKELLQEHIANVDEMQRSAAIEARVTADQPAWAYARIALQWAERYYASERELALTLIKDLDEADAAFAEATKAAEGGTPWPMREYWDEYETKTKAEQADR